MSDHARLRNRRILSLEAEFPKVDGCFLNGLDTGFNFVGSLSVVEWPASTEQLNQVIDVNNIRDIKGCFYFMMTLLIQG